MDEYRSRISISRGAGVSAGVRGFGPLYQEVWRGRLPFLSDDWDASTGWVVVDLLWANWKEFSVIQLSFEVKNFDFYKLFGLWITNYFSF